MTIQRLQVLNSHFLVWLLLLKLTNQAVIYQVTTLAHQLLEDLFKNCPRMKILEVPSFLVPLSEMSGLLGRAKAKGVIGIET